MDLTWIELAEENRTCATHGMDYVSHHMELEGSPAPDNLKRHWTNCPACNSVFEDEARESQRVADGGIIYSKRKQAEAAAPSRDLVSTRLATAGVPVRFLDCRLKTWSRSMDHQRRVWEWAMDYTESFDRDKGIINVFVGTPGTGKTHMGAAILADILPRRNIGRYTTVMDLLGRIRNTFNNRAEETEEQVIDELVAVDLLVIDEVGKALPTGFSVERFWRVVDKRHGALKHTLMIGNLSLPEFKVFAGEAMVDRIHEGGGKVLPFDWGSYRSKRRPRK